MINKGGIYIPKDELKEVLDFQAYWWEDIISLAYDALFGLLVPFFPKLATVAKFAPLFKAILQAFRGMRSGAAS